MWKWLESLILWSANISWSVRIGAVVVIFCLLALAYWYQINYGSN